MKQREAHRRWQTAWSFSPSVPTAVRPKGEVFDLNVASMTSLGTLSELDIRIGPRAVLAAAHSWDALIARASTGQGCIVRSSLQHGAAAVTAPDRYEPWVSPQIRSPTSCNARSSPEVAMRNTSRTNDGMLSHG